MNATDVEIVILDAGMGALGAVVVEAHASGGRLYVAGGLVKIAIEDFGRIAHVRLRLLALEATCALGVPPDVVGQKVTPGDCVTLLFPGPMCVFTAGDPVQFASPHGR